MIYTDQIISYSHRSQDVEKLSIVSLTISKRKEPGEILENWISKWPFLILEYGTGKDEIK